MTRVDGVGIVNSGRPLKEASGRLWTAGVLVACVAAWATPCWSQAKLPRVGVLTVPEVAREAFEQTLTQHGWIPGKKVLLEYRVPSSDSPEFAAGADELVRLKVDIIVAWGAPILKAARTATRTIPIVAVDYTSDPIAAGYADSYGRPGQNVTGVFLDAPEMAGKWVEMLRRIMPRLSRVAVLWDPSPGDVHLRGVQRAARPLNIDMQVFEVHTPKEVDRAFGEVRKKTQALIVLPSPMLYFQSERIAKLAMKHRLLATSMAPQFARSGGAISYGPDIAETMQRCAIQTAKILDGTKVGDLPVERPTKFSFLVNMKTMQALRLKVPDALLLGAELVTTEVEKPRADAKPETKDAKPAR